MQIVFHRNVLAPALRFGMRRLFLGAECLYVCFSPHILDLAVWRQTEIYRCLQSVLVPQHCWARPTSAAQTWMAADTFPLTAWTLVEGRIIWLYLCVTFPPEYSLLDRSLTDTSRTLQFLPDTWCYLNIRYIKLKRRHFFPPRPCTSACFFFFLEHISPK